MRKLWKIGLNLPLLFKPVANNEDGILISFRRQVKYSNQVPKVNYYPIHVRDINSGHILMYSSSWTQIESLIFLLATKIFLKNLRTYFGWLFEWFWIQIRIISVEKQAQSFLFLCQKAGLITRITIFHCLLIFLLRNSINWRQIENEKFHTCFKE